MKNQCYSVGWGGPQNADCEGGPQNADCEKYLKSIDFPFEMIVARVVLGLVLGRLTVFRQASNRLHFLILYSRTMAQLLALFLYELLALFVMELYVDTVFKLSSLRLTEFEL